MEGLSRNMARTELYSRKILWLLCRDWIIWGARSEAKWLKKMVPKEPETSGQCGELFRKEKGQELKMDGVWGALKNKFVGLHREKIQTEGPSQSSGERQSLRYEQKRRCP